MFDMIREIDVAFTDLLLAAVSAYLAVRANRLGPDFRSSYRWIFGSVAFGALAGAVWHAFLSDSTGALSMLVWRLTMLSIGVTAYGFATAGIALLRLPSSIWTMLSRFVLACYAAALFVTDDFLLAILIYLPALLLMLAGFIRTGNATGTNALLMVVIASVYQQWGPDIAPLLTHNAIYHLLLLPAVWLLFRAASGTGGESR